MATPLFLFFGYQSFHKHPTGREVQDSRDVEDRKEVKDGGALDGLGVEEERELGGRQAEDGREGEGGMEPLPLPLPPPLQTRPVTTGVKAPDVGIKSGWRTARFPDFWRNLEFRSCKPIHSKTVPKIKFDKMFDA
jgi:hypothetical protein